MADNGFGKLSMQVDDRDIDIGQDDALPSVETTMRFLALCDRYGSPETAVAAVARGRRADVPGLPDRREWPVSTAAQMRAAVEYLQEVSAAVTESGAAFSDDSTLGIVPLVIRQEGQRPLLIGSFVA